VLRFQSLSSGSSGNGFLVDLKDFSFLIDCGIPKYKVLEGLKNLNIAHDKLKYCFITHAHYDHISGLPVLHSALNQIRVVTTQDTIDHLELLADHDIRYKSIAKSAIPISEFDSLIFKDLEISAFPAFHDIEGSAGFHFREINTDYEFSYTTDTADVIHEFKEKMHNSDAIFLESNYDDLMLSQSNRPYQLKSRIRNTHLSNKKSYEILKEVLGDYTKLIFLGHLSGECNSPKLVIDAFSKVFEELKIDWIICERDKTSTLIEVKDDNNILTGGLCNHTYIKDKTNLIDQFFD
jgi:phosphoribosyl 1,2-cyclic phosphodiesterase